MNPSIGRHHGACRTEGSGHQAAAHVSAGPPEPRPFHPAGAGDREHLDPSTHLRQYGFNHTARNLVRLLGAHLETDELRVLGSLNRHARDTLRDTLDEIRTAELVRAINARLHSPNQLGCRQGCEASLDDIEALPVKARSVPLRALACGLGGVPGDLTEMGDQVRQLAQGLPDDDDQLVIEEAVTRAITPR